MSSRPFFSYTKTYGRLRVFILGKKIFSCNTDNNFFTRNFFQRKNNILNKRNFSLEEKCTDGRKKILFIVHSLSSKGGIESRVLKYAEHLRKNNIEPYFLCQYNYFEPVIKNFTVYTLRFYDANFQECLIALLQHGNFNVVEFQFYGGTGYFEQLDIQTLKSVCRVGVTLHGGFAFPEKQLSKVDYCCLMTQFLAYDQPNKVVQANGIDLLPACWFFNGQRKALFISRLDQEKLPTIRAFIDFCKEKNISPEIAGPLSRKSALDIRKIIEQEYGYTVTFLGEIDCIPFLKEHSHDYLFVGGVGQVPLEALSLGFPAFVCSHHGKEHSSFITGKNFETLKAYNCVIRQCKGKFPIEQELPGRHYQHLPPELLKKISFSEIFAEYRNIIQM